MTKELFESVIGLEVHIQLNTKSKMFCGCDNNAEGKEPNTTTCPVCFGMPGTLPVANKAAIIKTLTLGLALGAKNSEQWNFERKNYFYPDLPKGYQITSSTNPPCVGGEIEVVDFDRNQLFSVKINHLHLEEDAGKLVHRDDGYSYVDLNRAGTPLVELVTEPDIHSATEAKYFLQELQALVRRIKVSDADMEKGHMRCDANISLRKSGETKLGTKVEIKNLNSFRMVERALKYEIDRQSNLLERGEKIVQETRGWNDVKGVTESQRSKEDVQDYRYMPEPDIPVIVPAASSIIQESELIKDLPELPKNLRQRLMSQYNLNLEQAQVCVMDSGFCHYAEQILTLAHHHNKEAAASMAIKVLFGDVRRIASQHGLDFDQIQLLPSDLFTIIDHLSSDTLSHNVFKNSLVDLLNGKIKVDQFLSHNLGTNGQDFSKEILSVLVHNSKAVEQYLGGNEKVVGFLVGQVMKETGGKADPKSINKLVLEHLEAEKNK